VTPQSIRPWAAWTACRDFGCLQVDFWRKSGRPPPDSLYRFNRFRFNELFFVNSTQTRDVAKKSVVETNALKL
jgi:hypothetical protein